MYTAVRVVFFSTFSEFIVKNNFFYAVDELIKKSLNQKAQKYVRQIG